MEDRKVIPKSKKELLKWIRETPISLSGIVLESENARLREKITKR